MFIIAGWSYLRLSSLQTLRIFCSNFVRTFLTTNRQSRQFLSVYKDIQQFQAVCASISMNAASGSSTKLRNVTLCSPRLSSGQDPHAQVIVASSVSLDLPKNHVLIKVDRFGFSANNVTYQALGEQPHFRCVWLSFSI